MAPHKQVLGSFPFSFTQLVSLFSPALALMYACCDSSGCCPGSLKSQYVIISCISRGHFVRLNTWYLANTFVIDDEIKGDEDCPP